MIRNVILGFVAAAMGVTGATASYPNEALLERDAYLVSGVVACGNCHNTRSSVWVWSLPAA